MKHVALTDDFEALRLSLSSIAFLDRAMSTLRPEACNPKALVDFCNDARLGVFEVLALVLKADWEAHQANAGNCPQCMVESHGAPTFDAASGDWQPWLRARKFVEWLARFPDCPSAERMDVVLLEQWALGCHHLSLSEVSDLNAYHARSEALLQGAPASRQVAFIADKREWLTDEYTLTILTGMLSQRVQEMEAARMRFLTLLGDEYIAMVESGNQLALWRYRQYFDDVTMTDTEVQAQLAFDLEAQGGSGPVTFAPALEAVLRDRLAQLKEEQQFMAELRLLHARGTIEQATEDEQRYAKEQYLRLRRKIHPDALGQHPKFALIHDRPKQRLAEIWLEASAMHQDRVVLSRAKVLNYARNLDAWHREVDHLLCNLEFHDPAMLMNGDTLEAQWDYVRQSLAEVQRSLHAARNDLMRLEADATFEEHRRVIALDATALEQERARMLKQRQNWAAEAALIEGQMLAALRCHIESIPSDIRPFQP